MIKRSDGRNRVADTTSVLNFDEEHRTPAKEVNAVFVYVLNCHSEPLMPCHPRKARLLLKEGKAKVVKMAPFTLQLLYGSSGYKQEVSLGVDAGTQHIGLSATTEQRVLFEAEVVPRNEIQELLATRRQYRRARRNRKTRYRQARFDNRRRREGWLPPSLESRIANVLTCGRRFTHLCPVTAISIEVVRFDTQLMENPEISGAQYQQGTLFGYEVREYLLEKWGRKCAYCGTENVPLQIEHMCAVSRETSSLSQRGRTQRRF